MRLGEGPFVWGILVFLDGWEKRCFLFGWREKWYGPFEGKYEGFLGNFFKLSLRVLGFGLISQLAEGFMEMGERQRGESLQ